MEKPLEKPIEHIVLSGGGTLMLNFFGALKESHKKGIWKHENIKSLFGTSAGAIISVLISLEFDWDVVTEYIVHRPWENIFHFNILNILDYYENNGIVTIAFFKEFYRPLFAAKDIPLNITFSELKHITNKDLYIYATNFSNFEITEFSALSTPNVEVIDAVYASSSLPFIFKPRSINGVTFIDGFIYLDYPIVKCLEKEFVDPETVLGLKKQITMEPYVVNDNMNMLEYLMQLFNSGFTKTQLVSHPNIDKVREILITSSYGDMANFFEITSNKEVRLKAIESGEKDVNN